MSVFKSNIKYTTYNDKGQLFFNVNSFMKLLSHQQKLHTVLSVSNDRLEDCGVECDIIIINRPDVLTLTPQNQSR